MPLNSSRRVTPLILAGGQGARLWPLSTPERPKQFAPLFSERSLFQDTLARVADPAFFDRAMIVYGRRFRPMVEAQIVGTAAHRAARAPAPLQILEPVARDSAAAIFSAAALASLEDPSALILATPSDHVLTDDAAFRRTLAEAAALAARGRIVTFGVAPSHPSTAYGYIKAGAALERGRGFAIERFVEKPARDVAERLIEDPSFSWNSGMFVFRADVLLQEGAEHAPEIVAAAMRAVVEGRRRDDVFHLDDAAFSAAPALSIDHAVMEKTRVGAVTPARFGWDDVGAWDAISRIRGAEGAANVVDGPGAVIEGSGVYCRSDGPFVTTIGLDDVVVVATQDSILVTRKGDAQAVRRAAELSRQHLEKNRELLG